MGCGQQIVSLFSFSSYWAGVKGSGMYLGDLFMFCGNHKANLIKNSDVCLINSFELRYVYNLTALALQAVRRDLQSGIS